MKNKLCITIVITLILSLMVGSVQAVSPFDQACPNCHGAGTITSSETITCPSCHGEGRITTTGTCSKCSGTGKITVTTTCQTCGGDGKVEPTVTKVSSNGYGTLSGLDWVARCEITLQNEANVGTYCVVESKVHTVTQDYYRQSPRTYLAPHTNVKITVDTADVGVLTDWTYAIYVKSVDQITCTSCSGSGAHTSVSTCDVCHGVGQVTTTNTCSNCRGTGTITQEHTLDCPSCNGGYVTNWTTVMIVVVVGVVGMGACVGGVFMFTKKRSNPIIKP